MQNSATKAPRTISATTDTASRQIQDMDRHQQPFGSPEDGTGIPSPPLSGECPAHFSGGPALFSEHGNYRQTGTRSEDRCSGAARRCSPRGHAGGGRVRDAGATTIEGRALGHEADTDSSTDRGHPTRPDVPPRSVAPKTASYARQDGGSDGDSRSDQRGAAVAQWSLEPTPSDQGGSRHGADGHGNDEDDGASSRHQRRPAVPPLPLHALAREADVDSRQPLQCGHELASWPGHHDLGAAHRDDGAGTEGHGVGDTQCETYNSCVKNMSHKLASTGMGAHTDQLVEDNFAPQTRTPTQAARSGTYVTGQVTYSPYLPPQRLSTAPPPVAPSSLVFASRCDARGDASDGLRGAGDDFGSAFHGAGSQESHKGSHRDVLQTSVRVSQAVFEARLHAAGTSTAYASEARLHVQHVDQSLRLATENQVQVTLGGLLDGVPAPLSHELSKMLTLLFQRAYQPASNLNPRPLPVAPGPSSCGFQTASTPSSQAAIDSPFSIPGTACPLPGNRSSGLGMGMMDRDGEYRGGTLSSRGSQLSYREGQGDALPCRGEGPYRDVMLSSRGGAPSYREGVLPTSRRGSLSYRDGALTCSEAALSSRRSSFSCRETGIVSLGGAADGLVKQATEGDAAGLSPAEFVLEGHFVLTYAGIVMNNQKLLRRCEVRMERPFRACVMFIMCVLKTRTYAHTCIHVRTCLYIYI